MDKQEQINFVNELVENVRKDIVERVQKEAPESWDGHELRQYIADKFNEAVFVKMNKARMKEYQNTIMISGNL